MFESFSPTRKEREAIRLGLSTISQICGHDYRIEQFVKDEHRGYGCRTDSVPLSAAQGLCIEWFLGGLRNPNILLRDYFFLRPAAIYFTGLGAEHSEELTLSQRLNIELAAEAYQTAFRRMIDLKIDAAS